MRRSCPRVGQGGRTCKTGVHVNAALSEEIINRITAILAAAEILDNNIDLEMNERQAFLNVIHAEALQLEQHIRTIQC